jgi:hypothetical protein
MKALFQDSTNPSAPGLPIEETLVGMIAQFDVTPTDVLESPYSDCTTEVYDSGDSEESNLPPAMPFFDRRTNTTASAPMLLQRVLSRARSSSPSRGNCQCGDPNELSNKGRDILQTRAMTMSMPSLHTSRSAHNRSIGYSFLFNVAEFGGDQGMQALRSRIDEFDTLLGDL